jgi:hypothetical protein
MKDKKDVINAAFSAFNNHPESLIDRATTEWYIE